MTGAIPAPPRCCIEGDEGEEIPWTRDMFELTQQQNIAAGFLLRLVVRRADLDPILLCAIRKPCAGCC